MRWLRILLRLPTFAVVTLVLCVLRILPRAIPWFRGSADQAWRKTLFALWARLTRRVIGMRVHVDGPLPDTGSFVVTNHVSYIDVLLLANFLPARFVAKSEVARWPFIGRAARAAGTLFVNRQLKRDVVAVNDDIVKALQHGDAVVLFAEGTSSSGDSVLTLKPSLLNVPATQSLPVSYGAIRYRTPTGYADASQVVCWWGDMEFLPHFVNLLGLPGFDASVKFGATALTDNNRKRLAARLHESISARLAAGA